MELGEFGDLGPVRAEARFAVGERVFKRSGTAFGPAAGEPLVVAEIDRETRASLGEWLIAWAEEPRLRRAGRGAGGQRSTRRGFEHVLLAGVSDQTTGGQATADLDGFAPGDIPLLLPDGAPSAASSGRRTAAHGPRTGFRDCVSLTAEGIAAAELRG